MTVYFIRCVCMQERKRLNKLSASKGEDFCAAPLLAERDVDSFSIPTDYCEEGFPFFNTFFHKTHGRDGSPFFPLPHPVQEGGGTGVGC